MSSVAVRFAFGAAVSVLAGLVSLLAGSKTGGLFLAFPAILPAALTLIEKRDGISAAISDVRGASVGAIGLALFAVTVLSLAVRIGPIPSLAVAAAVWAGTAIGGYWGGARLALKAGEEPYLPQVAASEAEPLVDALRRRGLRLGVAESCTGGALAALITAVPNASDAFAGGIVAYSEQAKADLLGVPQEIIERFGTVSEQCSTAMAQGAERSLKADVGVGITGVIGSPIEGEETGTIYLAVTSRGQARCIRLETGDDPEASRGRALREALRRALELVQGQPD